MVQSAQTHIIISSIILRGIKGMNITILTIPRFSGSAWFGLHLEPFRTIMHRVFGLNKETFSPQNRKPNPQKQKVDEHKLTLYFA